MDKQSVLEEIHFTCEGKCITLFANGTNDHLFKQFVSNRSFYELDLLTKIREVHRPGTAIVDVGANIGNHTIFFAKIMGAEVFAFEPFPTAQSILRKNIEANRCTNVVVSELALGEISGPASAGEFDPNNIGTVRVSADVSGNLMMGRLDDCVASSSTIGVIKIDVEGGELSVLRGAEHVIGRDRPDLFIEAHTEKERDQLEKYLQGFDYRILGKYCPTPTYWFGRHNGRSNLSC